MDLKDTISESDLALEKKTYIDMLFNFMIVMCIFSFTEAILRNPSLVGATEAVARNEIKVWLRNANDREGGRRIEEGS